jgi:hypothetical protein
LIAYFDTSAVVPLLIDEPSSTACRELWNAADRVLSSRISYVEASAALAAAARTGRISEAEHTAALTDLEQLFWDANVLELDERLGRLAAGLVNSQSLRGYDAVQCASAVIAASDELVAVSGDSRLLAAWSALGIATVDTGRAYSR